MTSSGGIFDVDEKRRRIAELEHEAAKPGFWDNQEQAQALLRESKLAKSTVEAFDHWQTRVEDALVLLGLAEEAEDAESALGSGEAGRGNPARCG